MTRAWKVGERCLTVIDGGNGHIVRPAVIESLARRGWYDVRYQIGTSGRSFIGSTAHRERLFADEQEAELCAAECTVALAHDDIVRGEELIAETGCSIAERRVFLAKAEKKLAALRAKVKP